jgi:hypothetical protein
MALTSPLCKDPSDVIDWAALGSFSEPLGGPLAVIRRSKRSVIKQIQKKVERKKASR